MSESRTRKSLKNVITGFFYKIIGILLPFMIRTVMIKKLGAEYLGLNTLFTSILQVLSLTELGLGSAMVYSMYKPIAERDTDRVCALLTLYRRMYSIIGSVILLLGLALMPFLKYLIKGTCPSDINIYALYLIYLFNTVISYFLYAYKKSILDALQKSSIENLINIVVSTMMYIMQLLALLLTSNYYIYIIFLPISTLILNIIRNHIVTKRFPQYVCRGNVEQSFVKDLYGKIKALIGHKIGATVLWFADSIVISSFLGLNVLAIYSNYYYIMNAIIGIMAVVYNSVLASIGNSLVTESEDKNHRDFMTFTFINNWIVGICAIALLCLYQPFMIVWMGSNMTFPMPIVIVFVFYFYSWLFNKIGNTYKNAAGMWQDDFYKPYVSAGVNLLLNIILVNVIGVAGVLISTIVSSVLIETPWETWVLYKKLFKRSSIEYIKKIISYLIVTIISGTLTYFICVRINIINPVLELVVRGIICVFIPNVTFFLCYCKTKEFRNVKNKYIYMQSCKKENILK